MAASPRKTNRPAQKSVDDVQNILGKSKGMTGYVQKQWPVTETGDASLQLFVQRQGFQSATHTLGKVFRIAKILARTQAAHELHQRKNNDFLPSLKIVNV